MFSSAPLDLLRRYETANGLPQCLAPAVVAALVERAVLPRRVDPHHLVAAADERVGSLLDDYAVGPLRDREGQRCGLAGLDRADPRVTAVEGEVSRFSLHRTAGIPGLDPFREARLSSRLTFSLPSAWVRVFSHT